MNILVCIKQVPDMESKFKISSDAQWYDQSDLTFKINEYDEYAIEETVRLKEKLGNVEAFVLSIGPERVKEAIRKALAIGVDKGVHVLDNESHKKDPFQIASIIANYAKDKNFDIVFLGMQSQDRASAQVGPILSELLGYNCVTTIVGFEYQDGKVNVKRELEGGIKAKVSARLPVVLTCQLGLNTVRYPTLPNIMKAKKKELVTINVSELLNEQPRVINLQAYIPEKKKGGIVLEGKTDEMADKLISILKEKTQVLR
ncbi:MAG: electron transfer flavoprotein beta subunit/FixA family protein [Desulfurella sp.]|jgi:electron transfer flavoprotein beta subunit